MMTVITTAIQHLASFSVVQFLFRSNQLETSQVLIDDVTELDEFLHSQFGAHLLFDASSSF